MDTNKAIKLKVMNYHLVEGHEFATKLQQLLSQPGSGQGSAEDLAAKILETFNKAISILDSVEPLSSSSSSLAAVEGSQNASCDNDGKFEDSGDSRKRLGPVKGKRGCYKRKKRSETWTKQSPILEDTYSWRKYGQKEILNAKFPRSYFRCTHKYTQGCKATKQVQKVELEPKMFSITYMGSHTCNTNSAIPMVKACDNHHDEITMDMEEHKSPSLTTSMKEEEENHRPHGSSTENNLVWPDIVFEEDHHHHHQAIYVSGDTSTSINVLGSHQELMMFGAGGDFEFSDNEHYAIFNSCSNLS
ncbi:PREDICTED: probable WRKY transcription factor 70 isoform X2 [Camelina sativa]|uniref:Probable WRKY transcription factor 70 isoform X1 n=1 Tax=Camelina sativa TaxID=90675 RepID=A0ABM0ZIL4_CAMSA|nr:PREDICTED: probable WRKY transcription factor 70 isoform X1 [Camelina sativa]XP_010516247.1 PREDICTED: probable WRKY transcription factor 70 isoform X2 [Camelina sativa]